MLDDTERRLNTLFDELNNSEVSDGVAQLMLSLVQGMYHAKSIKRQILMMAYSSRET